MTAYKPTYSNLHSAFSPTPLEEEFYKTKPTDKKKKKILKLYSMLKRSMKLRRKL